MSQAIVAKTAVSLTTLRKPLANITFLLSLFPYLTLLKVPWDIQPWALIFALAYLALMLIALKFRTSFPGPLLILILATLYGISVNLIYITLDQLDVSIMLRRLAGYVTIITIAFVAANEHRNIWSGWLFIAVLFWLGAAVAQKLFGSNFIALLLPRVSTNIHRGIVSLAPEPSYYAVQMGFFMLLNEIFRQERRYSDILYQCILLLCIVQLFLSLSGTGFLILTLFVGGKVLSLKQFMLKACTIIFLVVATTIFIIIPAELPKNPRICTIINEIKYVIIGEKSIKSLLEDRSIAYRLINPIVGFYGGLAVSRGIGFGWGRITEEKFPEWLIVLLGPYRYSGGKPVGEWKWGGTIMGGIVAIVYELGIVGLLYISVIFWLMFRTLAKKTITHEILIITLILMFGGFVSLAHPLLGYLIGLYMVRATPDGKKGAL